MGKLRGKIAVIAGAASEMALATASLFVEEGAYCMFSPRTGVSNNVDEAVKGTGKNVTGVQGDAADPVQHWLGG